MKKHNYSAGPSILPQEDFEKSAQAILNFNNSGLSILEISHRSKDFVAVMDEARALALESILSEGDQVELLFLIFRFTISNVTEFHFFGSLHLFMHRNIIYVC